MLCKFPIVICNFDLSSSIFGVCTRWLLPSMKYDSNLFIFCCVFSFSCFALDKKFHYMFMI